MYVSIMYICMYVSIMYICMYVSIMYVCMYVSIMYICMYVSIMCVHLFYILFFRCLASRAWGVTPVKTKLPIHGTSVPRPASSLHISHHTQDKYYYVYIYSIGWLSSALELPTDLPGRNHWVCSFIILLSLSDLNFYNSTILPPFPCPLGHLYSPYLSLCFTSSFLSLNKFFNTA